MAEGKSDRTDAGGAVGQIEDEEENDDEEERSFARDRLTARQRDGRQIDAKGRPLAYFSANVESAFSLFNQSLDDVQSKARSVICAFGGEVRLENFGENFGRNSGTVIPD